MIIYMNQNNNWKQEIHKKNNKKTFKKTYKPKSTVWQNPLLHNKIDKLSITKCPFLIMIIPSSLYEIMLFKCLKVM